MRSAPLPPLPHRPGKGEYMTTTEINIPDALRDMRTNWYFCSMDPAKVLLAAADEIERLRAENTQLRIERDSYLHSFDVAIGLPDDSEDDSEGDPRVEDHYGE